MLSLAYRYAIEQEIFYLREDHAVYVEMARMSSNMPAAEKRLLDRADEIRDIILARTMQIQIISSLPGRMQWDTVKGGRPGYSLIGGFDDELRNGDDKYYAMPRRTMRARGYKRA